MNIFLSSYLIISALVLIALGIFGFQNGKTSGSKAFSFLMFAMAIHTIAYSFELLSFNVEMMYFWVRVEYIGAAFYPFLIFWFIRAYTGEQKFANRYMMGMVLAISMMALFLVQTNFIHHWYYNRLTVGMDLGFATLIIEKGFWYYIQVTTFYFSISYALIVLGNQILKTRGRLRKRIIFIFIGVLAPMLITIFYLWGPGINQIDFLPFSYLFLGLFITYGLYRYDILTFYEITHEVIFNAIDEAVIVVDDDDYIVKMNQASENLLGALGPMKVGHPIDAYPVLANILKVGKGQLVSLEDKYYQVRLIPIEKRQSAILVFMDMTEITEAKKQLEILANTDQLTALYNRRYFREYFDQLGEEGIIMLMDIDHFKKVNDQYGHPAGDIVLGELSQYLKEYFEDGIICRYGGEEFVVMIERETIDQAKKRGEAFRVAFQSRQTAYLCTISMGICAYKKGDYTQTMQQVDELLYQGKAAGRNCVVAESNR